MAPTAAQTCLFAGASAATVLLPACATLALLHQLCNWRFVAYGAGAFLLGIAFHSLLALPAAVFAHGLSVLLPWKAASRPAFASWELAVYALAAGIGQETAKVTPLWLEQRGTTGEFPQQSLAWLGLSVGLGFSLAEIAFLAAQAWQPHATGVPGSTLALVTLERFSAGLFHMATATWLAFALQRGTLHGILPVCMALHALLDGFASFTIRTPVLAPTVEELALLAFSATLFTVVVAAIARASH